MLLKNKLKSAEISDENFTSVPMFRAIDDSACSLSLNSLRGTTIFAIWPWSTSWGSTSETALYPSTV